MREALTYLQAGMLITSPLHYLRTCIAGKTTLLEVLAGKHMVNRDAVRILGRPAFYDLMLVTSGELGYLGNQWRRSVACAGSDLTLQVHLQRHVIALCQHTQTSAVTDSHFKEWIAHSPVACPLIRHT